MLPSTIRNASRLATTILTFRRAETDITADHVELRWGTALAFSYQVSGQLHGVKNPEHVSADGAGPIAVFCAHAEEFLPSVLDAWLARCVCSSPDTFAFHSDVEVADCIWDKVVI